jgi:hypothetical protein
MKFLQKLRVSGSGLPGIPGGLFGYMTSQPHTAEFSLGEIWEIFES